LFVIGLLVVALLSPWWILNGDDGTISTNSKTLLIPSKIVSITESNSFIGGEISLVPEEVTMVLGLIAMLVILTIIILFSSILTKYKFEKITKILSIFGFVLLIIIVLVFFYAMSQMTMIGVGGFSGSGDVDITLPGTAGSANIPCSWGPGIGFYLSIIVIVIIIAFFFLKRRFSNIISD
jgi:hypothetical protein